jgi:hypothetical protein
MCRFLLFACLALASNAFSQSSIPELDALRKPYQKSLATLQAAKAARAQPVIRSYVASLQRLETQSAGNPASAAAIRSEIERANRGANPADFDLRAMPPALAELRRRYENDLARTLATQTLQEQQLTRQYLNSLDNLQRRLTAHNQVANAAAVKAERDAVASADPTVGAKADNNATAASSTIGSASAKAAGALEHALAQKISAAVSSNAFKRTENSSEKNTEQKGWADIPAEGGVLVGFEFFEVNRKGGPWIRSARPYFLTQSGLVAGKDRGQMEKVTSKILARPGYGVAGLLASDTKAGLQIIFMKIDPATGKFLTDPSSTYKSSWVGTKGREEPKQVGGDGRLVIGVYGKTGSDCDDLGFIVME